MVKHVFPFQTKYWNAQQNVFHGTHMDIQCSTQLNRISGHAFGLCVNTKTNNDATINGKYTHSMHIALSS